MKYSSCYTGQITFISTFFFSPIYEVEAWVLILSNYAPVETDNHPAHTC